MPLLWLHDSYLSKKFSMISLRIVGSLGYIVDSGGSIARSSHPINPNRLEIKCFGYFFAIKATVLFHLKSDEFLQHVSIPLLAKPTSETHFTSLRMYLLRFSHQNDSLHAAIKTDSLTVDVANNWSFFNLWFKRVLFEQRCELFRTIPCRNCQEMFIC